MKKIGKFLLCILPFLCALLIQVVVSLLAAITVVFMRGFKLAANGELNPDVITDGIKEILNADVMLAISILTASVCILVFGIWFKRSNKREESNNKKRLFTLKNISSMLLLAAGLQFGISILLNVIAMIKPDWFNTYGEIMEQLGMGNSILSLIYIALIAPISEELIFRGVVFGYSRKFLPIVAANILQALLFGAYHLNLVQGLYAFVLGMFLGIIRMKFNTLYASILLHMLINISGIFLNLILTDKVLNIPIVMIAIALLSLGAIVFGFVNLTGMHGNHENDRNIEKDET
jgi:uncharacterized protein